MNPPDRPTSRSRHALDRRRRAIRPLVESLEGRLQLSLVAATGVTAITAASFNQASPSVAMDAAGDYVVAWTDQEDGAGTEDTIEAQVFNPNGTTKTPIFFVDPANTTNGTVDYSPSVAMDPNGDFVVAWVSSPPASGPNGYYYNIAAQRFSLTGTAVGQQMQVNTGKTSANNQTESPTVAMTNQGFVVGWSQLGVPASNDSIDGQRYSFSGATNTAVGSNFVVATASGVNSPSVAADAANDFVFVWDGTNGTKTTVNARGYNASGVAQSSALSIDASVSPFNGKVAMNAAGHFVIGFEITPASGNDQVYAHQFALTGTESNLSYTSLSGDVPVYAQGTSVFQGFPSVGIDAQGFATITWVQYPSSSNVSNNDAVEARRLNPDGTTIETTPIQVAPASSSQDLISPRVAVGALGNAAFVWGVASATNPSSGPSQINARLYSYVNNAPTINTLSNVSIAENGSTSSPLSGISAGGNEEQTLTVTASSSNTTLIVPTVTYTSPNSTGTLNLAPIAGQSGTATITVTVTDSGGTANGGTNSKSVQFTLTVDGVPTANAQTVAVAHDSTGTPITLTGSDSNSSTLPLTYALATQPAHGTLTGFNSSTGAVTYKPPAGYHGTDSFTFTASESNGTSSPATVTLNVAVGTPTANAKTVGVAHDSSGTPITLTSTDDDVPALMQTYAFTQPSHGTVTVSGSAGSPTIVYTPAAGYHGPDSFTFTASNGTNTSAPATVTLNVAVGTPTANAQSASTPQGTAVAITLTGSDDDSPALPLTYAIVAGQGPTSGTIGNFNPSTGALTYTPNAGYTGPDSFQFTVSNGTNTSSTATVSITVTAPAVASISGTVGVTWGSAGSATLLTNADGLRLLPSGRNTDLPWLGINTLSITLSQAEALSPSDVTVSGITVANYGPVAISGSGTQYTLTLARPINAADRVTVTIGNANIATFTRRLDVLPGDVNDDGFVTSADVGVALGYSGQVYLFADVDGDGTVTTADTKKIRSLNGTSLPPLA